ncbi:hypothetical protein ABEX77_20260 [Bacillus subtilis]|uniref:hypothetical protein n=1 Tax=Bacillus halotolerans TaxID=260554 RepID=UPI00222E1A04|nr:hypothetical protein [Bacillus halotolerans]UZD52651.1 hypothetical protein OMK57_06445 [Bacillus halotolerans]
MKLTSEHIKLMRDADEIDLYIAISHQEKERFKEIQKFDPAFIKCFEGDEFERLTGIKAPETPKEQILAVSLTYDGRAYLEREGERILAEGDRR